MVARKDFSGDRDAAIDYAGEGNKHLAMLKHSMKASGLLQARRSVRLANGVELTVSSVFGQDTIRVFAPPALRAEIDAQLAEQRAANLTPTTATPDFNPALPINASTVVSDTVSNSGTVTLVITKPNIFIGGSRYSSKGYDPVYWRSDSGLRYLKVNNRFSGNEGDGDVLGLSPDGEFPLGYVSVYDGTINPATINPFNGSGGVPYGLVARACVWRDLTEYAAVSKWASGEGHSRSYTMSADRKTVYGVRVEGMTSNGTKIPGGGIKWNGLSQGTLTAHSPEPQRMGLVSADGRVKVSGNKYQLDGGAWVEWGDSACVATCVVHAPPTTTTLVFSG